MSPTRRAPRHIERGALAAAAVLLLAWPARADWSYFFPRPIWNGVYLDLSGSFERDEFTGARRLTWEDTFFKERLSVESYGYWYHPRFLQYELLLGAALKQEKYESSDGVTATGYTSDQGWDGNLRLVLLPEHPYNLIAFASRFEPVYKEQAEVHHDSVETTHGVTFRLRRQPYFFSAFYTDDTIDSGTVVSDVRKVGADGQYYRQLENGRTFSFTGAASRSQFGRSGGLDGTIDEYHLGNLLHLGRVRLTSDVTATSSGQDSATLGAYTSDQFLWHERLNVTLPWRLRADLSYRYRDDESTIDAPDRPERALSNRGHDVEMHLVHRLYESLDTTYTFLGNRHESSGGTSTALAHSVVFNYAKSIPRGHILAGLTFGTSQLDTDGHGIDIVDEAHSGISVPTDTFLLAQQNVDEASIAVFLRSPLPPFEVILLTRGAHYSVRAVPNLNTYEIHVFALPAQFTVPGTYDFLASYALESGGFTITTGTYSGSVSVALLDNLVTPYMSYSVITSDVTAGSFPGDAVDATTYAAGVRLRREPFSALAEYEHVDSIVSPYAAYKGEVQVRHQFDRGTSVNGSALYLNKRYLDDTFGVIDITDLTETRQSIAAGVQQQLFGKSLLLAVGASYSRTQGIDDSRAYSGDASLNWKIGKLDVSAGASTYAAETIGDRIVDTSRDHATFYVRIRRKIF